MAVDMNAINLEISADSSKAAQGIETLVNSLQQLKDAASGATSALGGVSTKLKGLATGTSSFASAAEKTSKTAQDLAASAGAVGVKADSATAGVQKMAAATKSASAPASSLTKQTSAVATGLSEAEGAALKVGKGVARMAAKFGAVFFTFQSVHKYLQGAVTESNKYIEDVNLFRVAMDATGATVKGYGDQVAESLGKAKGSFGSASEAAQSYAEIASKAIGLDPAEWMKTQGVFASIISGFGVAGDKAATMSQQLTQLGYDLSSYANISVSEAFTKLQSGISGELEPLRRLGYDLSVARLQQEAYKLGIKQSVSSMTQAQKAQLRYYAIMTQVTWAQGDMARTITAPANALRILQAQVQQATRAIGNMLIPILQKVVPYLIAFFRGISILANAFAKLLGFKAPKFATAGFGKATQASADGVGALADNTGRATKRLNKASKAAKKFKNQLLGFDEINNLTLPDKTSPRTGSGGSSGGSGVGGVGGDFNVPLPTYDFLGKVKDYIDKNPIVKFFNVLAKHAKLTMAVLAGFGTMLVTGVFGKALGFAGKKFRAFILIVGGLTTVLTAFRQMWTKGMDWDSMAAMLLGFSATALGVFNLLSATFGAKLGAKGALVVAAVGGFTMILTAFRDFRKNGPTKKNVAGLVAGIGILATALKILGLSNPVTLVLTGIAVAAAFVITNWDKVVKFFKKLPERLKKIGKKLKGIGKFVIKGFVNGILNYSPVGIIIKIFKKIIKGIKKLFGIHSPSKVMKEMGVNVIKGFVNGLKEKFDSILEFFEGLPDKIKEKLEGVSDKLDEALGSVKDVAIDVGVNLKKKWDTVQDWFDGLGEKALEIVADLKKGWSTVKDWFSGLKDDAVELVAGLKKGWSSIATWFSGLKDNDVLLNITGFAKKWKKGVAKWFHSKKIGHSASLWITGFTKKWTKGVAKWFHSKKIGHSASLWITGFTKKWKGSLSNWVKSKWGSITLTVSGLIDKAGNFIEAHLPHRKKRKAGGGIYRNGGWRPIATAATGGAFNQGQMFIAREAGPELVGTIGGHTAVMNNNQIVSSVSDGVYRAVLRAMAQSSNSGGDVILTIDGRELGRAAIRGINSANRQMGRTQVVY